MPHHSHAGRGLTTLGFVLFVLIAIAAGYRARTTEAANPSTVSGEAYGVSLTTFATTITKFPEVDLDPQGGSASANAAGVNVPALLTTGTIDVSTQGTSGLNDASSESSSTVEQLNILAGLITADVVTAQSSSSCDGTSASSSSAGTTLTNLVVAGVPIGATPPPNTVIGIPGGSVTLNEQIAGGNGMNTSSLTVNLIHVNVNVLILGNVDIVIASAHSDVVCQSPAVPTPTVTATPAACVPGAPTATASPGAPIVSGEAFDIFIDVPPVSISENPHVVLAPSGGMLSASVNSINIPGTISTGTLTANTNGSTGPMSAASDARAEVDNLNLLAGLVTADLIVATSNSSCDGISAVSNDAGTQFVNLVVNGTPIAGTPPPNTVINVPAVATIVLNEQIPGGDLMNSSSLTINMVHVTLLGGLGEAIIASAHSDVDCAPITGPTPTAPLPTCTPNPTVTASPTVSPTPTVTETPTPTATETPGVGATVTQTPIVPTLTVTPTPAATPTPDPMLNHFLCYEIHRARVNLLGVSVVDQFGSGMVTVKKAKRVCLPVDKNDEDQTAPGDPQHLISYTIKRTSPGFSRIRGLAVTNQFGSTTLDLVKPDRLLVPTAKNLAGFPPPPNFVHDHFQCYKVAYTKLRVDALKLDDQFGTLTQNIRKPLHLCVAANKNGEGIPIPGQTFMCYKVRTTSGTTRPPKVLPDQVYINNQFGPDSFDAFGPREICVPSTLN